MPETGTHPPGKEKGVISMIAEKEKRVTVISQTGEKVCLQATNLITNNHLRQTIAAANRERFHYRLSKLQRYQFGTILVFLVSLLKCFRILQARKRTLFLAPAL